MPYVSLGVQEHKHSPEQLLARCDGMLTPGDDLCSRSWNQVLALQLWNQGL